MSNVSDTFAVTSHLKLKNASALIPTEANAFLISSVLPKRPIRILANKEVESALQSSILASERLKLEDETNKDLLLAQVVIKDELVDILDRTGTFSLIRPRSFHKNSIYEIIGNLEEYARAVHEVLDPEKAERRWVAKVLKAGLKTREDVVRAYHSLVLNSRHSVASWWTHRKVESHLTGEISPQLGQLLQEITDVYEEARYLPPGRELNAQQIQSVETAIRQFEAAGA